MTICDCCPDDGCIPDGAALLGGETALTRPLCVAA